MTTVARAQPQLGRAVSFADVRAQAARTCQRRGCPCNGTAILVERKVGDAEVARSIR